MREAQHPLPNGDIRQHVVDEMRGPFGHAAPTATGTEPAPFAREGHEAIVTAAVAVEARESSRETPAGEELAELPLDEPGQPLPVPQRRRLQAERLEVIADNLEQDALRRIARLVAGRCGHARRVRPRCASGTTRSIRPNSGRRDVRAGSFCHAAAR